MPNPTYTEKISTTTFLTHMDDGTGVYTCRTLQNDIFTETPDGKLHDLDPAKMVDYVSEKAGPLKIKDRVGKFTVGYKQDGSKDKCIGLRPSTVQDGSRQIEISLGEIKFDSEVVPVDLNTKTNKAYGEYSLGKLVTKATRHGLKTCILVDRKINDFDINFTIHADGYWIDQAGPDEFIISEKPDRKFAAKIAYPKILDLDFNEIPDTKGFVTCHFTDNGDGSINYTKVAGSSFDSSDLPDQYYIDVDIIFSSTADGTVENGATAWGVIRSAATGTAVRSSDDSENDALSVNNIFSSSYVFNRCFFYFDTSGVIGSITGVDLMMVGFTNSDSSVDAQEGTQAATLTTADYDSFTDAPNGTSFGNSGAWNADGTTYNVIAYNPAGIASINQAGETLVCCREEHDFGNDEPAPSADFLNGVFFANNTGTDKDPKFEITVGAPPVTDYVLEVLPGSVALDGATTTLTRAAKLVPAAGSVEIAGTDVLATRTARVVPAAGSVTVSGAATTLTRTAKIGPGAGSVAISGAVTNLTRTTKIVPGAGSVAVAGSVTTLTRTANLVPTVGTITIVGKDVILTHGLLAGPLDYHFADTADTKIGTTADNRFVQYHDGGQSSTATLTVTSAALIIASGAVVFPTVFQAVPGASVLRAAVASLSAVGTLTATSQLVVGAAGVLEAVVDLTSVPSVVISGEAALAAVGTVTPNASRLRGVSATGTIQVTLTPVAKRVASGTSLLQGVYTITAAASRVLNQGAALLTGEFDVTATPNTTWASSALLEGVVTVSPTAQVFNIHVPVPPESTPAGSIVVNAEGTPTGAIIVSADTPPSGTIIVTTGPAYQS